MDTTKLWRPEDIADFMQLEVSSVQDLINKGDIPAYRLGETYRVAWKDIESFLQRQRTTIQFEEERAVEDTSISSERGGGTPQHNIRKDLDFEKRALDVLREVRVNPGAERPFLTAYEIAVKIAQALIAEGVNYDSLNIPIGGQGSGQHRSLSKMVAIYLASRDDIAERTTRPAVQARTVDHHGRRIVPSVPEVSAFRLKEGPSSTNNS